MQDIIIFPEPPPGDKVQLVTPVLPVSLTSLIGREQEVKAIHALLLRPAVRLLTLTGTAGVGKTRLALQVATALVEHFADGVHFISLAPIHDPDLVIATIAQSIGLKDVGGAPLIGLLKAYLGTRHLLLTLDNFEQVVTAAPLLAELLEACPELKILVTSREVLHLRAEQQFLVSPLALPDLRHLPESPALAQYAAVALFLQRAQAINPDIQLTLENAACIAEICTRLDGLPLALELAAARIKLLSLQALLSHLSQRLQLLTRGMRDAPVRQQTLRDTLAWSYDLLTATEQRLFRRLSIFVGGCTLEAAAGVCAEAPDLELQVLEGVASLLDKSLLWQAKQADGEPRLLLLETIREYGLECLTASGELQATRDAHACYYFGLGQQAVTHLTGAGQVQWYECLEREYTNVQAALQWAVEREGEEGRPLLEQALQLGGDLCDYWFSYYHERDGLHFLEQARARDVPVAAAVRAAALNGASMLAYLLSDFARAEALCRESGTLFRAVGDQRGLARNLSNQGFIAWQRGDFTEGRARQEEGLMLAKAVGDMNTVAWALWGLGDQAIAQGEYARAQQMCEESLALYKAMHNQVGVVNVLNSLAQLSLWTGELGIARSLTEEFLSLARELNIGKMIGSGLRSLGQIAQQQGDYARARTLFEEALAYNKKGGDLLRSARTLVAFADLVSKEGDDATAQRHYEESLGVFQKLKRDYEIPACLERVARTAVAQGQAMWATRLLGAAQALRESLKKPIPPVDRSYVERLLTAARTRLGEQAFTALLAEGRMMSLEQVLADREPIPWLKPVPTALPSTTAAPPVPHAGLTPREMDVLRLLAQGLTSAQIAEQLVIGLVTVNSHVRSIYSKLGVTSRAVATRYALEQHLL